MNTNQMNENKYGRYFPYAFLQKRALSDKNDHNFLNRLLVLAGVVALAIAAAIMVILYDEEFKNMWGELESSPMLLGIKVLFAVNILVFIWRVLLVLTRKETPLCEDQELLTCTVIIPAYNEGRQVLETMRSVARSNFPMEKLQIVCVDDGSRDDTWHWMQKGGEELGDLVELVRQPANKGKRHALYEGIKRATGQILVTIDSDSEVDPMALRQMSSVFSRNHRVGAVAGNVRVLNLSEGILPKMLDVVFTFTFDFIRLTQSRVNTVFCTPGALSGYRHCAVEPILEEWLHQRFLGKEANIGEDRAMTNKILREGWLTHFQSNAVVYTNVPTRYIGLSKMYLRWARSNVRETLAMGSFIFRKIRPEAMSGARINYCLAILKLVLAEVSKAALIWSIFSLPAMVQVNFIMGLLFAGMVPAMIHRLRHGGWDCIWAFPYIYFSTIGLSWISLYALLTPHRNGWLTRNHPQAQQVLQMLPQSRGVGELATTSVSLNNDLM